MIRISISRVHAIFIGIVVSSFLYSSEDTVESNSNDNQQEDSLTTGESSDEPEQGDERWIEQGVETNYFPKT